MIKRVPTRLRCLSDEVLDAMDAYTDHPLPCVPRLDDLVGYPPSASGFGANQNDCARLANHLFLYPSFDYWISAALNALPTVVRGRTVSLDRSNLSDLRCAMAIRSIMKTVEYTPNHRCIPRNQSVSCCSPRTEAMPWHSFARLYRPRRRPYSNRRVRCSCEWQPPGLGWGTNPAPAVVSRQRLGTRMPCTVRRAGSVARI